MNTVNVNPEQINREIQSFEHFQQCLQPFLRMVQFVFIGFKKINFSMSQAI